MSAATAIQKVCHVDNEVFCVLFPHTEQEEKGLSL